MSLNSTTEPLLQEVTSISQMPSPMNFTIDAAKKVKELIEEEGNPELKLRVFVTGGGCSGFQYGFSFEEMQNDDDTVIEKYVANESEDENTVSSGGMTVRLLIDPMSFQYLTGADIDYKEDIDGARFIIRNPNAQTTCGCGSSFSA